MQLRKEKNEELNEQPETEVYKSALLTDDVALKDKKNRLIKERLFILSAIIIQLTVFAIFYIYAHLQSFMMAFQLRINDQTIWTVQNFKDIFEHLGSELSGKNVGLYATNTFKYFLLGQIMFPIAFMTSYFMYKKIPLAGAYRILFFLPSVVSSVVWSNIYRNLVGVHGPIAGIVQSIGGYDYVPKIIGDSRFEFGAVVGYSLWFGVASNFVLYSGTLTRIPKELIEVGMLDGIKWYQELIKVIVPLVWSTVSTVWLMSLMGIFTASGNILLLGTGEKTYSLGHYMFLQVYNQPETSNSYNYSSALGLLLTICTLPVVFIVQWLLGKVENVEY